MHSSRVKLGHDSNHTTRHQHHPLPHTELTTVGEYAVHHLLTSFIKEADERIERCMTEASDSTVNIEPVCGPGVDPAFDQLIKSLGHIGRDRPKLLIDSVMIWRRGKGEVTNQLYTELQAAKSPVMNGVALNGSGTVRRLQDHHTNGVNSSSTSLASTVDTAKVTDLELKIRKAERQSAISVYILCRVLMEIIGQCRPGTLPNETADRLEDVIWNQVRNTDPDSLQSSMIKQNQWNMFGQLLGIMSASRFDKIVDRYVAELGAAQVKLCVKGHADRDTERKAALLVENMRWLKLRLLPDDAWDQTCNLLQLLAGYFANVHGRDIKHAYCQLLEDLLLPIAGKASMQLNTPKWKAMLDTLKPKINQLVVKPKHWMPAFPTYIVMLCVSPIDHFNQQWLPAALNIQSKLKDRATRSYGLKALCRLVWRYLYRVNDVNAPKKLDEIVRMIFQTGRKAILSTEPAVADPLIQLIRIIGYKHQDFCFKSILFPLMNADVFLAGKDLRIDALEPDRMVVAIRAFLAIMSDLEKGEQPPFPLTFECDALLDSYSRSPHSHRRSVSQSNMSIGRHIDRLSKPVLTTEFCEITKEYYVKFCKILGEITIICDNTFGGQAVWDERFAQNMPKTPMSDAFAFSRRDEIYSPTDARQSFYDLLHVAVQALPRCLSPQIPFNSLVNLLCTGTAHVQSHIASSSSHSLKAIARESHAQQVTIGFARFIFNFDDRYATVADGGLLGPQHIESTLRLYVELLEIWIEDLQRQAQRSQSIPGEDETRAATSDLNRSRVFAHVDEIESHGLFFLCSPSRHVRAYAIRVLRLVNKFDSALGQPSPRIISILEGSSQQVIDVNDEKLTTAERSRLQKGLRKSNVNSTLVELCSGEIAVDSALWVKAFPNLIRLSQQICPQAVLLTRAIVCARLLHIQSNIARLAEPHHDSHSLSKVHGRTHLTQSDVTIEQWKLHLIFACTTLTNAGSNGSLSSQGSVHVRKVSKSSAGGNDKITSAGELFGKVVHFLGASNERVRVAAAVGLGTINSNLYKPLLEALQPSVAACVDDTRARLASHQRAASSPRRARKNDHLLTEVTHLYQRTVHCLREDNMLQDEWVLQNLFSFTKELRIFLNDEEVQSQWMYQKLRIHFCGLVETLYENIRTIKDTARWMPFHSRKATFSMMEDWCGYSPDQSSISSREDSMRRTALEHTHDHHSRVSGAAAMEIERKDLRNAALSAMASLCAGPISIVTDGQGTAQFDVRRMLEWIDTIFVDSPGDKGHVIGRRALKNLITHNQEHPYLLTRSIEKCYLARSQKALTSYFDVVTEVLMESPHDRLPFWKILCAALYTLGNEKSEIRMKSLRLLRNLEGRYKKNSKLQDLDISISDKTTAVYKLAQFQVSQRLANQHSGMVFHVFSEFSIFFKNLQPDHQRNMVTAMLPWMQAIELVVDKQGNPTASSYMLLVNLFEITIRSSAALHNEIQALWQAIATGPYGGNVQVVLDFIIAVCLARREQNFVDYARQVSVFLSGTPAGAKVVEFLLLQLTPRAMIPDKAPRPPPVPAELSNFPYVTDLAQVLPVGATQQGLSLAQVSLMLLVDLVVSPIQLAKESVPVLLQTIFTQWDHHASVVRDLAREMLVHLIHELVISKIETNEIPLDKQAIEELIDAIRRHDPKLIWDYNENEAGSSALNPTGVCDQMSYLIEEVIRVFSVTYRSLAKEYDFRMHWARVSLDWATTCAVRHVACRSFQIFRCILTSLDQQMLGDMLQRLSNTIADDEQDYLTFSTEILITLRSIIGRLERQDIIQFPQLFWITAACLDTIYEREFQEGLTMIEHLLDRLDLSDPAVIKIFMAKKPEDWRGNFNGLQALVYKGIRSSLCIDRSLAIMDRMLRISSSELVGDDTRLQYTLLGNLPRFLNNFDDPNSDAICVRAAETIALSAESQGFEELSQALESLARHQYRNEDDFLKKTVAAMRTAFFPNHEFDTLVFLVGLLNNQLPYVKIKTMKLLCIMIPDIDLRKPDFSSQGPDLISPVLRLLQTSYCQQALDVLDNVMSMTGTPLDNKHIRMSMAGSHSSRATRKEYESTKSLYGIPEESGWSVPMPAIHSARTRANVQAVVRTCVETHVLNEYDEAGTPKLEFQDDAQNHFYFASDQQLSAQNDSRLNDGNMSELVMKLDSLDEFFDDQEQEAPQGRNSLPLYSSGLNDDRETLYDRQTLPILHKSLNRNASVTSFQTGFADARYFSPREPTVMTPTAFAPMMQGASIAPQRPGPQSRSITSPVGGLPKRSPPRLAPPHAQVDNVLSGDEGGDEMALHIEPFSDDELSLSRTQTPDDMPVGGLGRYGIGVKGTGMHGFTAGFRSGMRRLTGGGEREKPNPYTAMGLGLGIGGVNGHANGASVNGTKSDRSPKIPSVPERWQDGPASSEL